MNGTAVASPITDARPSDEFLRLIPHDFARRHLVLSAGTENDAEWLLVAEETPAAAVLNTRAALLRDVRTEVVSGEELARAIDAAYAQRRERLGAAEHPSTEHNATPSDAQDFESLIRSAEADLLSTTGKAPLVRLVDAALFDAIGRHASDIHVQPLEDRVLIRYRVDGTLATVKELPARFLQPIVSRIKVMGGMDIAERREPQDGRATVTIGKGADRRSIDLRISTIPTACGERAVLRVLDQSQAERLQSFEQLGMPADIERLFKQRCTRSHGLVLVTGPTGSGKSTTLYTTLRWICSRLRGLEGAERGTAVNIMTIEDPIEFSLPASGVEISQSQVNNRKGMTFATGLRHVLRQDPDVVMVGEIRDGETARLAIQASLTGHLVFSTLHTNDAASAVTRLLDLGVEPYLVGSSLTAVLAQRLVRTVHRECGGAGCAACLGTGFRGRTGVYELLLVDDAVRHLVSDRADATGIAKAAVSTGMRTLVEAGQALVDRGVTTATELARVTAFDSEEEYKA